MSKKNASKKKKTAGASKKKQVTAEASKKKQAKERKRIVGEFAAALWNLAQVGVFFAPSADASEETHEIYQNNYPLHLINFANKHFDGFGAERTEETTEELRRDLEWRRMAPDLERIGIRLAGGIFGLNADLLGHGLGDDVVR